MLQSRWRSSAATVTALEPSIHNVAAILNNLTLCSKHAAVNNQKLQKPAFAFVRYASHAAQGRANGPGDSAGRRLGAKKTAQQFVIPGNIIFKQRGTKWFPGENVGMGKDHTIYATESGYVRYYKNPDLHPKRRYIGVALEKEGPGSKLPTPRNAPTRRRLGMYASPINKPLTDQAFLESHLSDNSKGTVPTSASASAASAAPVPTSASVAAAPAATPPTYRPGKYWPSNYEIGKAAEKKGITVREFDRKDRWLAWRKRAKKVQTKILARAAKATRKTKGKKSNKGASTGAGRTKAS